jgi:toxin ParE1/3/4
VTAAKRHWPIRLAAAAEADIAQVLRWTVEHFGQRQARIYADTLAGALEDLSKRPEVVGARARDDIAKGVFTLHVARHGRKGRHFVMFRIGHDEEGEVIDLLRVLHEAMDLPRHLPPQDEES